MIIEKFTKRVWLFFLICYSFSTASAQTKDSSYLWSYTLPSEIVFVTSDALQQIYVATEDGYILKFDKDGQLLFEYSNKRLGKVGVLDASNPFNVLVYYPELARIILLDRTLSELKTIPLFDLQIFEPKAVALSNDNHIWVYDPINFQLKKISRDGEVLFQSKYLNQTTRIPLALTFLLERDNQLIASDTTKGIFIFDAFGQLKQQVEMKNVQQFQVEDNRLIYYKDREMYSYSLSTATATSLQSFLDADFVFLLSDRCLVIRKNEIAAYTLNLNRSFR